MTELYVKVKTDQKVFDVEAGPMLEVNLTEKAKNGHANAELIRELSTILNHKIAILEGRQKPRKKIKVDLSKEEIDRRVEEWAKQR